MLLGVSDPSLVVLGLVSLENGLEKLDRDIFLVLVGPSAVVSPSTVISVDSLVVSSPFTLSLRLSVTIQEIL